MRNGGGSGDHQPKLLVAKGSFYTMGGAERDLIRNLPALSEEFEVVVATLSSSPDLESVCEEYGLRLMRPEEVWSPPSDTISKILDSGFSSATKSWKSIVGLVDSIGDFDCIHITSGDGSLGILGIIPDDVAIHFHLLEPHRGLHEDVLHRMIDGTPKRNLGITRAALSRARIRDLSIIRDLSSRESTMISGNSEFTSSRIGEVYGIPSGVLLPSLDSSEFPFEPSDRESAVFEGVESPYVVTIGRASWAKGTWEVISMLQGSGHSLALVGGADEDSISSLAEHAKSCKVGLWIAPRLASHDLCTLVRGATAVVSMAHSEPFGLTPIEAQSLGTPALFVNEGGFRETVSDGVSGRLLPRDNHSSWHDAINQSLEPENRVKWSENGRENVSLMGLNPRRFSERLASIFRELV